MARFESGNLETLKGLVERRFGMTLLPALAAAGLATRSQQQLLIPFDDPVPSRAIQLVRRRQHHREPLVRAVAAVIREVVRDTLSANAIPEGDRATPSR
jgi:DNA-binding transcriptional LysR family regulator